ncbi:MAG: hypothetical protein BWX57_00514 [Tenericutes bacterium ADurb.Bin024]|nr:MAG: hypothetical protein BWX57_00514 [Tenericutes bacterium ADurb.Bin024]
MVEEINLDEHPLLEIADDIIREEKRRKRTKKVVAVSAFIIIVFIIISYLGYAIGYYIANATSLSLLSKDPEARFAQVGFRLSEPITVTEQQKYNLQSDEGWVGGEGHVYWTTQNVSPQTMSFVLEHEGFSSTNRLTPVTSGAFVKDENPYFPLTLYEAPKQNRAERHNLNLTEADPKDYFSFTVLFRLLIDEDRAGTIPLDNIGIYFNRDTKVHGQNELPKALRFGFQSGDKKDIISPGRNLSENDGYLGSIAVGGRLDLDDSRAPEAVKGFYDYTFGLDGAKYGETGEQVYEIAYGEFTHPLTNENWGEPLSESEPRLEHGDVFHAVTYQGVRPLVNAEPERQYFTSFQKYMLDGDKGEPLAYTNNLGVAEMNIKFWLEGWDLATTNKVVNKSFGMQLHFVAKRAE